MDGQRSWWLVQFIGGQVAKIRFSLAWIWVQYPKRYLKVNYFGHVKGAYTDARQDKPGRFEIASGGTIFLDEIGNISLPLQSKLLTVLQHRKIQRVGSNTEIPVDFRLICATNMPLHEMVYEKKFRQDLLYRMNTVEMRVPSLRERVEDIPLLVDYFLHRYALNINDRE